MKTFFLLLACIHLCTSAYSQKRKLSTKRLIGIWKYIEMRDDKGKKIKSYSNGYMMVNAGGPTIIFNSDGTYKKIFTPQNADTGFWRFDSLKMYIHYDLYIDSTDWVGKDLIKTGEAVKYPNGNYYEKIQDKILRYDDPELILDERGSQMVFKKQ